MKTRPTSIRFDENDLSLALSKAKMKKPQKLVDFLISEYVREFKPGFSELPKDYMATPKVKVMDATKPANVVKPAEQPKTNYSVNTVVKKPEIDRDAIIAQIKAIEAEKVPAERNTQLGRQSWKIDQQKRINELKRLLQ